MESPKGNDVVSILESMRKNRLMGDRMDFPLFFSNISQLYELLATEKEEVKALLSFLGKDNGIIKNLLLSLREDRLQDNEENLMKHLHVTHLLGLDVSGKKEVVALLTHLKEHIEDKHVQEALSSLGNTHE